MNPGQIKKLKSILDLALEIERQSRDGHFSDPQLQLLTANITALHDDADFQKDKNGEKLLEAPKHFSPKMTVRHFSNLFIPLQRWLDRSLRDDEFLTHTVDQPLKKKVERPLYFILDNIRSAFNVGSIFRLADGVGASEILLCGYTPGTEQEAVLKTSLSSNQYVKASRFERVEAAIEHLHSKAIPIVALETVEQSIPLFTKPLQGPIAFLVGNERFGIDYSILKMVTEVRHIPMFGVKNSLNVAQALSVAAFEWSRQNP